MKKIVMTGGGTAGTCNRPILLCLILYKKMDMRSIISVPTKVLKKD